MHTSPEMFLQAIAPYREARVVAVACLVTWYGLADLCAPDGRPFVLGHALSRQAIHGGKATNDPIDAQKMAVLLRGGLLPQADGSPADRRATRDLLRRRHPLVWTRAEWLTHVQHTTRQSNVPELGNKIAYTTNRPAGAARFPDPAVHTSGEVALAWLDYDDPLLRALELTMGQTATQHDANTLSVLQTVPGIGKILRLVLVYALHALARFPRVQDCVPDCRLGP